MQQINLLIQDKKFTKGSKHANSRGDLIGQFKVEINKARVETGYPPMAESRIGKMMAHLSEQDLYAFLKECQSKRHFYSHWWWALKPKVDNSLLQ